MSNWCLKLFNKMRNLNKNVFGGKINEYRADNFPKLMKGIKPHLQGNLEHSRRISAKKTTFRHILLKLLKIKDQEGILRVDRGKQQGKLSSKRLDLSTTS